MQYIPESSHIFHQRRTTHRLILFPLCSSIMLNQKPKVTPVAKHFQNTVSVQFLVYLFKALKIGIYCFWKENLEHIVTTLNGELVVILLLLLCVFILF